VEGRRNRAHIRSQGRGQQRVAIETGGAKLRELSLIPFNTQLLAEVVALGINAEELGSIRNQRQLLDLYWKHRIRNEGALAEACLTSVVTTMVEQRSLEINIGPIRQGHADILDRILHGGALVTRANERFLAFRHNILFDYAASRLFLNPATIREMLKKQTVASVRCAPPDRESAALWDRR
jgi:hypothetical protein